MSGPAVAQRCRACGAFLSPCPSCGDNTCACVTPWLPSIRLHYNHAGVAYADLPANHDDARATWRERAEVMLFLYEDGGMTPKELAAHYDVSYQTVVNYLLVARQARERDRVPA